MSDTNEPPRPDGFADEPAQTPPPSEAPPPPPPPADMPPAPPSYGGDGGQGGGYGAPPPGPYGQPAAASDYSPTEAMAYGWRKFSASPATLLVPMIVVFVGIVVVSVIVELVIVGGLLGSDTCTRTVGNTSYDYSCGGPGFVMFLIGYGLAAALISLFAQLLAAGLYKGATHVTDGEPFSLGQLFEGWDKGQVVIASLIIAAATFVGTLLCYIPGLIVGFLAQFTLLFIVDKQMKAVEAIKASIKLVTDNLGNTILFYLLALVVLFVGAILCGVGLLVAAPVALIGLAYTYRRLQGEPVVP
ncbi:MAG TPA: hypothetical protein VHR35_08920 [Nocardioides sp.]|nr:hypothetical protein [Nocardioides sp.]